MKRIQVLIDDDRQPMEAVYVGQVKAEDIDPVTGQWVWFYHSVNIRRPSGEWENLWLTSEELLDASVETALGLQALPPENLRQDIKHCKSIL